MPWAGLARQPPTGAAPPAKQIVSHWHVVRTARDEGMDVAREGCALCALCSNIAGNTALAECWAHLGAVLGPLKVEDALVVAGGVVTARLEIL